MDIYETKKSRDLSYDFNKIILILLLILLFLEFILSRSIKYT